VIEVDDSIETDTTPVFQENIEPTRKDLIEKVAFQI
jgi:hypothetical protein